MLYIILCWGIVGVYNLSIVCKDNVTHEMDCIYYIHKNIYIL